MTDESGCCSFSFPDVSSHWLLFIDFAFTFGTTVVYFADIVTDIITLQKYFEQGWYYAFGLSIFFIIVPSILVAVLEFNFLKKTYGKQVSWKTIGLRTILNIPFQLTVIWYHCQLTYTIFKSWLDGLRGIKSKDAATSTSQWYNPTTLERSRGASLSSLNELDIINHDTNGKPDDVDDTTALSRSPGSFGSLTAIPGESTLKGKTTWWKRLTREQWLSHLNKLKLSESMLESLPQLLINLYLIIRHPNTAAIQYVSAVLSYLSLCGGVVRYDKTKKDNEADRWMVDRTLLHSRAFYTRLEWPQLLFVSIYKGSFLAARSLAFVYFAIYLTWYILIPILIHWSVLLIYLVYKWYPDFNKVTRQLQQADYKYRAYMFLSKDFISVFLESLIGIFIHVRPYFHALMDQPYCFMFFYYVAYVVENITLFLIPGILHSLNKNDKQLELYRYYPLLATELALNAVGALFCTIYYLSVHKTRAYTAHTYPVATRILCYPCYPRPPDDDVTYWLPVRDEWTVCKQVETSELFFLTKEQLKIFRQTYTTVVRNDRRRGRSVECFVDDRCRIFYAPRSRMKKIAVRTPDDATLRPSYRKLKDAHERTIETSGEMVNNSEDSARNDVAIEGNDRLSNNEEEPPLGIGVDVHSTSGPTPPVSYSSPEYEVVERPVRKPRVKSLRLNRVITSSPESTSPLSEQNTSNQETASASSTPIPLPRKGETTTNLSDVDVTSLPPPETRKTVHPNQHPPRRIDDAAHTSSNRHPLFDDSTYRVRKHADSPNFKQYQQPSNDVTDDEEDTIDDVTSHKAGDIVFDNTGWPQTWI